MRSLSGHQTGQVILTDGRRWKVGAYQLNKTAMQGVSETNDEMLRNVCWHNPEQELFGQVNPDTGEVSRFYDFFAPCFAANLTVTRF